MAKPSRHYCCTYPGCGKIVTGSRRCERHKKVKRYDNRGSAGSRGYDAKWTKLRNKYIKAHPLCEVCLTKGQPVAATIVHHKVEVNVDPSLRLVWGNLQSVCPPCHQHIHNERETTAWNVANHVRTT